MSVTRSMIHFKTWGLIDEFRYILNLSFTQGIFPDNWKIAQITPLPKNGDLSLCNNYKPIALLPLPGKIAEKIIHTRLNDYLETNDILNEKKQGDFRKNNSTINSVSEFTHEMLTAINSTDISLAPCIDCSKSFDTVNHKVLLRIDNSGWGVKSTAPINEAWTGCSQRTYYMLHILR